MNKDEIIKSQADRIAELEKDVKPFAWYKYYKDWGEHDFTKADDEDTYWTKEQFEKDGYTPLYTTPQTKPLSDEEIYQIFWTHFPISDKEKNATFIAVLTHCARAIEERHGIK